MAVAAVRATLPGPVPRPVVAGKVVQKDVPIYLDGLGTVQAFNTVTNRARVDGQLQQIVAVATHGIDSDEFTLDSSAGKEFISAKGSVVLRNRDRIGSSEQAYICWFTSRRIRTDPIIPASGSPAMGARSC